MPNDNTHAYDIGIIGGGPAGLCAAIFARLRGFSVVIFEPKSQTIDKACGEGLMPSVVEELKEMGVVIPESHPFKGFDTSISREHKKIPRTWADGHFKSGDGWGVRRLTLHKALSKSTRTWCHLASALASKT